jgi:hypothetical protein
MKTIDNVFIPLSDGTRLAARIWMPNDAEANPVPALLESIPYRKDDGTVRRDARRQPYFAEHGYAAVRVDMRGSGDADGILYDEYLKQEQDDALEVIEWLAAQPWCDGNVGMHGISWGGFNSLQVAARRPPALKALIVIGFTDDRYNDDVHYMGGCLLASQMLQWAAVMFVYNAAPPDPEIVGERWREMWLERMEKSPPYIEAWLDHQRRDDYWKHGSVGEDYPAIGIPVLAVGGWTDSYNNSIPRLLAGLDAPRRGLIGPWAHAFPELGPPGPTVGFLQESVRWWDQWLKGIEEGEAEPPFLRSYIVQSEPPARHFTELKGYWVADPAWPPPNVSDQTFFLNSRAGATRLDANAGPEEPLTIRGLLAHGFDHIPWGSYGSPGSYPGDQRATDGESLSFTTAPLEKPLVLLGNPYLELELAADQPLALVAARLCDVAPDGASRLISWGLLNLAHRSSHEFLEPLVTGARYQVRVKLNMLGYEVATGHSLRIGISPTYARQAWPSPRPVTLTVFTGRASRLVLPVRTPQPDDGRIEFDPPVSSPALEVETLRVPHRTQTLTRDQITGQLTFTLEQDEGRDRFPNGMEVDDWSLETHTLVEGDPLSVEQRVQARLGYRRGGWSVRIETDSTLTCDETYFFVVNHMKAFEGEIEVFSKSWNAAIKRDHM